MKVSIAVTTWNGERFLVAQLASLLRQTHRPDEVVIYDDCSSDGTLAIARGFAARDESLDWRIVGNEHNAGLLNNVERAIGACTGDIVFLCDQDDVWLEDKIEQFLRVFAGSPEIVAVFSDAEVVDAELQPLGFTLWSVEDFDKKEQADFRADRVVDVLLRHNVVQGASLAFRRGYAPMILPVPRELDFRLWGHDGWFALILSALGRVEPLPVPLIRYRMHERNRVGRYSSLHRWRWRGSGEASLFAEWLWKSVRGQDTMPSWREGLERKRRHAELAQQRLSELPQFAGSKTLHVRKHLGEALAHFDARLNLPDSLLARLGAMHREWQTGRYHSCANGWKSVVRDFMRG
jgi:glycosyltransferase involved in cell wall biosynthesis